MTPSVRGKNWAGLRDVERETAEWVRWYNHERIHSSIDYMTPIEREVVYAHTIAQGCGSFGVTVPVGRARSGRWLMGRALPGLSVVGALVP